MAPNPQTVSLTSISPQEGLVIKSFPGMQLGENFLVNNNSEGVILKGLALTTDSTMSSGGLNIGRNSDTDGSSKLTISKDGDVNTSGSINALGSMYAEGDLTVGTKFEVTASTGHVIAESMAIASTLDVTGASTLSSTLAVTGASTLSSTLDVIGASTFADTLAVTGASTLSSTLDVIGASTFADTLAVTGASTLSSTLDVTGASTFADTLAVTGASTLSSTLDVIGASTFSDTLAVTGASTFANTLAVTGASTLSSTLDVTGASTFADTLAVTGASTFSDTLAVTGASTFADTLAVTGASTFADTLAVTGASTFADTLDVTGASTFANTLAVTGASTFADTLAVTGASTFADTLDVTGASTFADTLAVTKAVAFADTLDVTKAVAFADTLDVTKAVAFADTLAVTKAVAFADTLDVTKAVAFADTLDVTGASTLSSTLDVTGASTFANTLAVTGASTLSSTLDVTGASTLSSTLDVTGDVKVGGTKVVVKADTGAVSSDLAYSSYTPNASSSNTEFTIHTPSATNESEFFGSSTNKLLTTQEYVDKQIWTQTKRINTILGKDSSELDNFNKVYELVTRIYGDSDIVKTLKETDDKYGTLVDKAAEINTSISDIVSYAYNEILVRCSSSVWADECPPLPIPASITCKEEGWYFRNFVANQKMSFYLPANGINMTVRDIKQLFLNIFAVSNKALPSIEFYTAPKGADDYLPNAHARVSFYFNAPSPRQIDAKKSYCLHTSDTAPINIYNTTPLKASQIVVENGLNKGSNDVFTTIAESGKVTLEDSVVFFAIHTNASYSPNDVEVVLNAFNVCLKSGTTKFAFTNSSVATNYLFYSTFNKHADFSPINTKEKDHYTNFNSMVMTY